MSAERIHNGRGWTRAARLLATILLLGGMVAGPVLHAAPAHASASIDGGPDRHPPAPDLHHVCPVCITLASVAVAPLPAAPATPFDAVDGAPAPVPALCDRDAAAPTRARSPPQG